MMKTVATPTANVRQRISHPVPAKSKATGPRTLRHIHCMKNCMTHAHPMIEMNETK